MIDLFSLLKDTSAYKAIKNDKESGKLSHAYLVVCADGDFLSDYLGLSGYPAFKDKIEEMAVYSSLGGAFCELAVMKLYSASDAQDGKLFFERRAAEAERALKTAEIEGYAENARIETRGNFVILSMMPDNDAAIEKLKKALG